METLTRIPPAPSSACGHELLAGELARFISWRGHSRVPEMYCTADGFPLGDEVADARYRYLRGTLPPEAVELLSRHGMAWTVPNDTLWADAVEQLGRFVDEHGHPNVPWDHVMDDAYRLGAWLYNTTRRWQAGQLPASRVADLERLGVAPEMYMGRDNRWGRYIDALKQFEADHGSLYVPYKYVDESGLQLGAWATRCRWRKASGKLPAERVAELETLGFEWSVTAREQQWRERLDQLRHWGALHGDVNISSTVVTDEGVELGKWLVHQRSRRNKGVLSAARDQALTDLGVVWERTTPFDQRWAAALQELQAYISEHSHAEVPQRYTTPSGFTLGVWLSRQHREWREGTLSADRIARLEDVGVIKKNRRRPGHRRAQSRQTWEQPLRNAS